MRASKHLKYLMRKRKALKQQMRHLAHHYSLTGSGQMRQHYARKIEEAHASFKHNEQRIEAAGKVK